MINAFSSQRPFLLVDQIASLTLLQLKPIPQSLPVLRTSLVCLSDELSFLYTITYGITSVVLYSSVKFLFKK